MAALTFAPALPFLQVDPHTGAAGLIGSRCASCSAAHLGARLACSACCARGSIEPVSLSHAGALHTYAIVHRSYPGVATPFIAAVVDLDGGGALRGTLRGVRPEPSCLPSGLRIDIGFEDTGQRDERGRALVCHYFMGVVA
jgi:uncharacterized OB-fold protein